MSIATVVSVTTAVVGALFAALTWILAAAPGLASLRAFAACATCGALYACVMAAQSSGSESAARFALHFVILLNASHASLWLYYSTLREGRGLHRYEKLLVAGAIFLGALGFVPGALYDPAPWQHTVRWLGVHYYDVRATWLGSVTFVYLLGVLGIVVTRAVRRLRAGDRSSRGEVVGVLAMLATAVSDSLVSSDLLPLPYLLDLGYLALVLAVSHDLARRFVRDAKNLRAAEESLVRNERLAVLGEMAAVVANDVRAPVAAISARATELRSDRGGLATEGLDAVEAEADRLNRMVTDLLEYARPTTLRLTEADVELVARSAADAVRSARRGGGEIDLDLPPRLPRVRCDPRLLRQAFVNLLLYAIDTRSSDAPLPVEVAIEEGALVVRIFGVEVADTGARESLFVPFTQPLGSGGGLALPVARRILRAHGGDVVLDAGARGAVLRVSLPVVGADLSP